NGWAPNLLLLQNDPEAHAQIGLLVVERALRLDDDKPRAGLYVIDDGPLLICRNLVDLGEFSLDVLEQGSDRNRPFPLTNGNLEIVAGALGPDVGLLRNRRVRIDLERPEKPPLPDDILR